MSRRFLSTTALLVAVLASCATDPPLDPSAQHLAEPASRPTRLAWTAETSGVAEALAAVWGADATHVYAVGARGAILTSAGDGQWVAISSGVDGVNYTGVWGSAAGDVFVVGERCPGGLCSDGVILHSRDGFQSQDTVVVTGQRLSSVWGRGAGEVYAGGQGAVLRTTDGGASWQPVMAPASETRLWGDARTLLAVGGEGRLQIAGSGDGAAWQSILDEQNRQSGGLRGAWGSDIAVYAVGTRGWSMPVVMRSTDGGASWHDLGVAGVGDLTSLWGAADDDLYAAGRGGVWRSKDRGLTWQPSVTTGDATLAAIWGSGAGDVYAVGDGGAIQHLHAVSQ